MTYSTIQSLQGGSNYRKDRKVADKALINRESDRKTDFTSSNGINHVQSSDYEILWLHKFFALTTGHANPTYVVPQYIHTHGLSHSAVYFL